MSEKQQPDTTVRPEQSALRNRNYLTYLSGSVVSLHGLWIYRVALGWFAWELSGSELWVGIVAFTQFAPAVLFGPIFGVFADRFDRRLTSIVINAGSLVNMTVLGMLTMAGHIDIHVLASLSLVQGTLDGAHAPVRMSIVPNLVNTEQLYSAIALTSVTFNLSRFVGPALAGFVIATWDVATAFFINGISYIAFIAAMAVVRLTPSAANRAARKHPWRELMDGAQYILNNPTIRALLLLVAVASVFGRGALEMLPAIADAVLRGGATTLAILTSAIGFGAILAGLAMSRGTGWLSIGVIRTCLFMAGVLIIGLGMIDEIVPAVAIVVALGITLTFCGVGSQILIQSRVDDEVRGRVSSFWGMIAFGGTSLGSLVVGAAASLWALENAIVAAGAACALATLLSLRRRR